MLLQWDQVVLPSDESKAFWRDGVGVFSKDGLGLAYCLVKEVENPVLV